MTTTVTAAATTISLPSTVTTTVTAATIAIPSTVATTVTTTMPLPSTVTTTAIPQPSTGTKTVSMIILFPVQCLQSIQTKEIIIQILVSPLL